MVATLNKPPTVDEYESTKPPTIEEYEQSISPFALKGTYRYDIPEEPSQLSVWEPTLKERVKNIIGDMAKRSPFISPGKRLGQLGAHHLMESVSGLGLYIPDVLASKITQEDTLASAVDKITGFEPTPRDVGAGEAAKFITSLQSVGKVLGPAISRIPARPALQIILGSGVTFGGRKATEELAKKISTGKPIDVEGIHFDSGIGVLFGTGQVGVSKFLKFIKNFRALPKSQIRPARAEVNRALKLRAKGKPEEWERVIRKYGFGQAAEPRPIPTPAEKVQVKDFGKYPLGRPVERPPVVGKLAPQRPMAPITKPKAPTIAEYEAQPVAKAEPSLANVEDSGTFGLQRDVIDKMAEGYKEGNETLLDRPIAVRKTPEGFKIIEGHHRFQGAKKAGIEPPFTVLTEEQVKGLNAPEVEALAKELYQPPAKAEPAKVVGKEIKYEEKAITEPTPSPKVEPRPAKKVVPTGKLDPTNAKEAQQIVREHAKWVAADKGQIAVGGIFETKWDKETQRFVVSSVEYTTEQVDTAYRNVQKSVESPMPDVELFAMPGKEAQVQAIAQKMAKVKGVVRPKKVGPKPLTKPTALPKAKAKIEDHIKAVYVAAAKETERYAINGLKVEGDTIIATDGRRMFVAKGKWGKDGLYLNAASLKKGLLGKADKTGQKFPTWKDIVPKVTGQEPILVPSGGVYEDLDTVFSRVRQAALITTEESEGITIIENKDGSLGFAAAAPEVGHVEININPGGKILGAVNPRYLMDAIRFHAIRGNPAFEFYFKNWDRPMMTRSLDGKTNTVTMPINVGEPTEAITKAISEGKRAEQVKPKGKPGFVDVTPLLKAHKTFMKVLEPSRAVERIVGKEPYATVIKGIHQTDVGRIEFTEAQLVGHDKSIGKLGEWFNKFSNKDLRNFMLSRGQPTTVNAELIQQNAINNLPKALRGIKVRNAIEQIANFNYAYLQKVAGDDINKVADYFYGIYKDPDKVDRFLDYWRTTKRFTKEKKLPTVADAVDYGLELRNYNPIENLKAEYLAIAHLEGMTWMRDELLRTGKGKYIDETLASPMDWRKVKDPVFRDLRLQPDLAHLINNLIATNWLTKVPTLNMLRQTNNFLRTVKFIGSAFHLLSVAKQSVADSGYLGFLYKPTALRGFTRGFRANDPIFRTTAYKDYIRHGGGHRYSVESEARRAFSNAVNELNRNMGIAVKVGALPLKIPTGFVNWMFQSYIPKVKYSKYLDTLGELEKKNLKLYAKTGVRRTITSIEKINIIKEQQNFYGMMNERLFGRSGTVTTAMRFYFMSPGYAEGNYRTMLKAATQWGGKGGFKANRSRSNIINSWLITGIAATVGTLAFTGKPPKKPEQLDDARDLFKIDTGKMDEKDRRIMIDMMTYDKDYWNVAFNVLRLRPDIAVGKSWKRIGGMKAPTAEIIHDLIGMMMGKAILDWKEDRIYHITDPFLQKVMKLTLFEVKRLKPISVSVYEQSRKRDIDKTVAAVETLLGFRPTKSEKDLKEQKLMSKMISLRGQREELSWYIGKSTDPEGLVKRYNKTVNDILNSPYIPKSMKSEWGPKLLVDYEKVVTWKRFPAGKMTDAELSRAYDAHTLSMPYKRRGEPFRQIGAPKKGSERRVEELKAEAKKRGIELKRSPRKPPRR